MATMFHSREAIQEGDIVIVFMSRDNMTAITVTKGQTFHNKFGKYAHDEMIGIKFGSKMHSPPPQSGYIHLLRPTPELWTLSLPHRTQILYMTDIAYITMRLGVRVSGKVIEAGTGSGSMTHSLSRSVGERGKVHSFEYHKARFVKAGEEFEEHGLKNIELQHRNVCKDGFGDVRDVEAIFLDLPAPWEAIPHTPEVLNPNVITRICCFSPCLEQVLKTVTALREEGFSDISTQEVLTRTYDLMMPPPPGSHHLKSVSSITQRLRTHEKRKEERRVIQMRNAREKVRLAKEAAEAEEVAAAGAAEGMEVDAAETSEKRKQPDSEDTEKEAKKARAEGAEGAAEEAPQDDLEGLYDEPPVAWSSMVLTKPSPEMRGHTSYLTFATFYPASIRAQISAQVQDGTTALPTRAATPAAVAE
ncbi:tRNA methyltransferase complex GCD14 subunit [Cutaneotrichosporon oleaginosum]|uniref:tRNA (adenine(58)-N(1))-methyltransferase catalytic subunit TRM61 n=1 Tax=Cutaneotrichosporon oleaginosum TaxID=879819 RepID=A0A0J0XE32_9TREE|nr:tRNA methyltransferase complex GCD14 subunit [Cutaneotrichosporon oleaginosum]KLT39361.1 tRNA methyltransferase complex GCD14 subunit [Cutaneotrichosporon oleaginosum]TXT12093.1 hypothetical protein COLE_02503 [Cutaneotrichosporon oleaginosum]